MGGLKGSTAFAGWQPAPDFALSQRAAPHRLEPLSHRTVQRTSRNIPMPGIIQDMNHQNVSETPIGRSSSASSSVPSSSEPEMRW